MIEQLGQYIWMLLVVSLIYFLLLGLHEIGVL